MEKSKSNISVKIIFCLFACLFFLMTAFVIISYPPRHLLGYDNNEINQDWFDANWKLETIARDILNGTHNINDFNAFHTSLENNKLTITQCPRGYQLLIQNDVGKYLKPNRQTFIWNDDIIGSSPRMSSTIWEWNNDIFFIIIIPPIFLLLLNLFFFIRLSRKNENDRKALKCFIAKVTLLCSLIWLLHIVLFPFHWYNYNNSYKETESILLKQINQLFTILHKASETGLVNVTFLSEMKSKPSFEDLFYLQYYPIHSQEKNIHNGKVFVSKKPFFPYDYIRINVDLCNFIYYAPELTIKELSGINGVMSFTELGNGLWLGQYKAIKNSIHKINYSYIIASILWFSFAINSIVFLVKNCLRRSGSDHRRSAADLDLQISDRGLRSGSLRSGSDHTK